MTSQPALPMNAKNRNARRIIAAVAMCSAVAAVGYAQNDPLESDAARYQNPEAATEARRFLCKVSDLRKLDVLDRDGEKIGRVEDFRMDMETGRLSHLIIATGGWGFRATKAMYLESMDDMALPEGHGAPSVIRTKLTSEGFDRLPDYEDFTSPDGMVSLPLKSCETDAINAEGREIGVIRDWVIDLKEGTLQFALVDASKPIRKRTAADRKLTRWKGYFAIAPEAFKGIARSNMALISLRTEQLLSAPLYTEYIDAILSANRHDIGSPTVYCYTEANL